MSFGKYFNERNYSDLKNRIKVLEKKFKELEARTNSQTEVLNIPVVIECCNCKGDTVKENIYRCKECNCFHDKSGMQL